MEQQHCPFCGGTGRLRQSDSLHGRTEREWRPTETSTEKNSNLPPGLNFAPSEEQLTVHYLIPYALGWPIPGDHVVREQVYEKEPWDLLGPHRDSRYFLTTRTMHGSRVNRTVVCKGTWSVTASGIPILSAHGETIISSKTKLSYCVLKKKSTGYTMDEYEVSQSVINKYYTSEVRACVRTRFFSFFVSFTLT